MNCLVWNCCGLGNLRTGKELGEIVQAKDPFVVFIVETLADEARLDMIQANLDFEHKWVVPRVGHGGGLALFWRSSVNLMVMDSTNYYIDTWIDKGFDNEHDKGIFNLDYLAKLFPCTQVPKPATVPH